MKNIQLQDLVKNHLVSDPQTGLVAFEDATTGARHTIHPNIAISGSTEGMKKLYWGQKAIIVRWAGFYYNLSLLSISDSIDTVVAQHCQCFTCRNRIKSK